MTELPVPRVTSPAKDQPDNQSDEVENESGEENSRARDTNQLCRELRRDLETMRNAHRLIVKDIKSIQREFKELVRKAQEENALCGDFARESVFEYSDYSTETDDSVSCTEGDIDDEKIHQNRDPNRMTSLRKFASSSHAGESKAEDLVNFSKIVEEQRKNMFFRKGSHFMSTERRGSSMIIELDRNRRLNGRLLDEGHHSQKKMLTSMPRRNSAMPHVQYFKSPRDTRRDDKGFDNQRVSSYGMYPQHFPQDRQLNSGYNDAGRNPVVASLKDSRTASNGTSLRRLEYKRGSLSVEVGHGTHGWYKSHNGHRRASETLPNHVGSLFSQPTGRKWAPELRNSTDNRRTSVLLEEEENSFQGKKETNL